MCTWIATCSPFAGAKWPPESGKRTIVGARDCAFTNLSWAFGAEHTLCLAALIDFGVQRQMLPLIWIRLGLENPNGKALMSHAFSNLTTMHWDISRHFQRLSVANTGRSWSQQMVCADPSSNLPACTTANPFEREHLVKATFRSDPPTPEKKDRFFVELFFCFCFCFVFLLLLFFFFFFFARRCPCALWAPKP